ncbi:MAG TPA: serine O-acetyltransferase [Azospirillaceae bacterium]|nr:serine O-acetyltransferase [Azospirillaceae bacterium]
MFKQLRSDIACILERDPAARTWWEVLSCYPGLHAIYIHKLARWLWLHELHWLGRIASQLGRWLTGIEIHPAAKIGRCVFIDHGMGVVIGETAEIGDDVTLYHGVTLGGTSWNKGKRHPTLGDGVTVGAGAKILGPITIGAQARVGANAVVVTEVPPNMTVVGIPGRVVLPTAGRRVAEHGIDLDHHLMPDPVGKAIACLIQHINRIEERLDGEPAALDGVVCSRCGDTCDQQGRNPPLEPLPEDFSI